MILIALLESTIKKIYKPHILSKNKKVHIILCHIYSDGY